VRRPGRPSGFALAWFAFAFAVAYFAGLWLELPWLRLVAKPVPAIVLGLWVTGRGRGVISRGVAFGLALSAAGDVLLELGLFVPGLLAFLTAHVAYTAAFVAARPRLLPARAVPFIAYGVAVFLALRDGLGPMTGPVGLYVVVICTMIWRAAARVADPASPAAEQWLGLAGALAFAASDTLIAFDRFHAPIRGASLPIMALYWLGQWSIAASAREPAATILGLSAHTPATCRADRIPRNAGGSDSRRRA
jgi:alkenylglycerophosphocholine/alkenylglycerophosphoethanolamine hydrolase